MNYLIVFGIILLVFGGIIYYVLPQQKVAAPPLENATSGEGPTFSLPATPTPRYSALPPLTTSSAPVLLHASRSTPLTPLPAARSGSIIVSTSSLSGTTSAINLPLRPTIPAAPSNLVASVVSATQISLRWTSNSTNEVGFIIERMPAGGGWVQIATAPSGATAYQDASLNSPAAYYYRVYAYNSAGNSLYSNIAVTTIVGPVTSAPPPIVTSPVAPSNLVSNAVSQTQVNLSWTRNSTNEDGFKIERLFPAGQWSQIAAVTPGVTTYQDPTIIAPGSYSYRVYAYNSAGTSSYSNVVAVTINCPSSLSSMLPRDLWVWQSAVATNPASTTAFFNFTDTHAIRTIYLESEWLIQNDQPALANFINQANAHCMSVELLFGYSQWALTANQPYAVSLAQDAVAFARTATGTRPQGVHYDVEPYILPQWSTDENGTANQYLDLLGQIASTTKGTGLRFTEDIPFWFDGVTVLRGGQNLVLSNAAIDLVDRATIMDFRDTASRIIDYATNEMSYASTVAKQITIGVNTTCSSPLSYTTFCSDGATVMEQVLGQVNMAYGTSSAFKGFAVHDYIGYQALQP